MPDALKKTTKIRPVRVFKDSKGFYVYKVKGKKSYVRLPARIKTKTEAQRFLGNKLKAQVTDSIDRSKAKNINKNTINIVLDKYRYRRNKSSKPGPQGKQGLPGLAGKDGAIGKDGLAGRDGVAGIQGLAGPQGNIGPIGPQGVQGFMGRDGRDGVNPIPIPQQQPINRAVPFTPQFTAADRVPDRTVDNFDPNYENASFGKVGWDDIASTPAGRQDEKYYDTTDPRLFVKGDTRQPVRAKNSSPKAIPNPRLRPPEDLPVDPVVDSFVDRMQANINNRNPELVRETQRLAYMNEQYVDALDNGENLKAAQLNKNIQAQMSKVANMKQATTIVMPSANYNAEAMERRRDELLASGNRELAEGYGNFAKHLKENSMEAGLEEVKTPKAKSAEEIQAERQIARFTQKREQALAKGETEKAQDYENAINSYQQRLAYQKGSGTNVMPGNYDDSSALWSDEINEYFKDNPNFLGTIARDEIPDLPKYISSKQLPIGFIMNLSPRSQPGTHWVGIMITPTSVEYFDPAGERAPEDIREALSDKIVSWRFPNLVKFKENRVKLQDNRSNHCGYMAIRFIDERFDGNPFKTASRFERAKHTDSGLRSSYGRNDIQPQQGGKPLSVDSKRGEAIIRNEFELKKFTYI